MCCYPCGVVATVSQQELVGWWIGVAEWWTATKGWPLETVRATLRRLGPSGAALVTGAASQWACVLDPCGAVTEGEMLTADHPKSSKESCRTILW